MGALDAEGKAVLLLTGTEELKIGTEEEKSSMAEDAAEEMSDVTEGRERDDEADELAVGSVSVKYRMSWICQYTSSKSSGLSAT